MVWVVETKLTDRQENFAREYCIDWNGKQAAIRAGYSEKTAEAAASRLLRNVKVKEAIEIHLKKLEDESIADATEVMQFITSVLRGEATEQTAVGLGDGYQELQEKPPNIRERLKAAELMAKRHRLFDEKDSEQKPIEIILRRRRKE